VSEWIASKDRLPEPWVRVLIYRNGQIDLGEHSGNEIADFYQLDGVWSGECVTHWMPLPAPPEDQK
jgi:hypothetical protein